MGALTNQTIDGVPIAHDRYSSINPLWGYGTRSGQSGVQTINGRPIDVAAKIEKKPSYIAGLNALPRPFTVEDLRKLLKAHRDSVDVLREVLRLADYEGGVNIFTLEDSDWFELFGTCWPWYRNPEAHLDRLMEGPFFEAANRLWYDREANSSPREIQGRRNWRARCLKAFAKGLGSRVPDEVQQADNVTLYRGCHESTRRGIVWHLDRDAALARIERDEGTGAMLLLEARTEGRHLIGMTHGGEVIAWEPQAVSETSVTYETED